MLGDSRQADERNGRAREGCGVENFAGCAADVHLAELLLAFVAFNYVQSRLRIAFLRTGDGYCSLLSVLLSFSCWSSELRSSMVWALRSSDCRSDNAADC